MRRLTSENISDNMAYMEENIAEVRQVTRRNMADIEEKSAYMAHEMKRKPAA